jgi:hypothetical protein
LTAFEVQNVSAPAKVSNEHPEKPDAKGKETCSDTFKYEQFGKKKKS